MAITTPEGKAAFNAAVAMVLMLRRAELGLTIFDVEAASGIKYQAVQSYLSGDRAILLGNFIALSQALQTTPSDVLAAAFARLDQFPATVSGA